MTNVMTAQATRSSESVNPRCERTRASVFMAALPQVLGTSMTTTVTCRSWLRSPRLVTGR